MRQNFHDDPDARQKTESFEVGMRVKVISPMVDFYAFRGETGTVESNSGGYLGIIVRFDEPRRFKDGHVQGWFNFNYYDLELLLTPVDADEYARVCAEIADLRRQLAEAQEEIEKFEVLGIAAGADDPTSPESILTAILHNPIAADLSRQLATCQEVRLAELALGTQSDAVLERAAADNADLRRQLAECQAAASPALIEEYARACHYAGSSGLAIVDWPQWLSRRAARR